MAYDASKEKTVVISDVEKNSRGEYFRISQKIPTDANKLHSIDIRIFYTPEDGGELRPTQKGVRFNTEQAVDVMCALFDAMGAAEQEELLERLNSATADESDDGDSTGG